MSKWEEPPRRRLRSTSTEATARRTTRRTQRRHLWRRRTSDRAAAAGERADGGVEEAASCKGRLELPNLMAGPQPLKRMAQGAQRAHIAPGPVQSTMLWLPLRVAAAPAAAGARGTQRHQCRLVADQGDGDAGWRAALHRSDDKNGAVHSIFLQGGGEAPSKRCTVGHRWQGTCRAACSRRRYTEANSVWAEEG